VLVDTISIDNSAPLPVRRPATVAELCDVVKEARAAGQGVYPVGGRTTLDVGLPPSKPGVALDTTALNRVIDYPARDMTITVQAGITIAALEAELAKEGQWLPVDVASPEKATLGGAIALNQSGPRRYGYGTLRDYVIGISFVTDDGVEVKAGGRVVKNVAGYDLMKLQIGAVGTLGVVTQVTLKVKPKPEASALVRMHCTAADLGRVLDFLHASKSRPVLADVTSDASIPSAAWSVWVGFDEKAATVEWQVSTLLDEFRSAPVTDVTADRGSATDLRLPAAPESRFVFKATVRPGETARFCNAAGVYVRAHALNGIVYGYSDYPVSHDGATPLAKLLADTAAECGGTLTVPRCPVEMKKSLPVWGKPSPAWELMRHVKKTLDPDNVFNPGRLFGDI
jgi:glycolate oxidase FAD binding subunit